MPTTFKASRTAWKNLFRAVILLVGLFAFLLHLERQSGYLFFILGVYMLLSVWQIRYLLRVRLDVDELGVRGVIGRQFSIGWQSVIYAEIFEVKDKSVSILLITEERAQHEIPLRSQDEQAVCDLVLTYLPPACVGPGALERLRVEDRQQMLSETWPLGRTFRIRIAPLMCAALWGCVVLLTLLITFLALTVNQDVPWGFLLIPCFLILLLLFLFFLFWRTMEIDGQRITERNWFGEYTILWSEVEKVKTDKVFSVFVIEGHGKRFTCNGTFWWGGADAREAQRLVIGEFERRGINLTIHKSLFWWYFPWPHASTKISTRW